MQVASGSITQGSAIRRHGFSQGEGWANLISGKSGMATVINSSWVGARLWQSLSRGCMLVYGVSIFSPYAYFHLDRWCGISLMNGIPASMLFSKPRVLVLASRAALPPHASTRTHAKGDLSLRLLPPSCGQFVPRCRSPSCS